MSAHHLQLETVSHLSTAEGNGSTIGVDGWHRAAACPVTTTAGGRSSASGMHLREDHL